MLSGKKVLAEAGLVLASSSGFIGARMIDAHESVYLILFWRFALAALLLSPWLAVAILRGLALREIANQAFIGFLAMFCFITLAVKAVATGVPASTAALITALQPLATAIFAGPILGEKVSIRQWLGLMIALAGIALATGGAVGHAPVWGYGLALVATICFVLATLISKLTTDSMPICSALAIQSAVSAVCILPLAIVNGGIAPQLTAEFATIVLWFVVVTTGAGYGLYWLCLRQSTASHVARLTYLTPPVTAVWAYLMFGEPTTVSATLGLLVCVVAVFLIESEFSTRKMLPCER
ncbi:DMT family transporter [Bradyrhizobium sp. CCBAU 53421]|uniref:DMT family transporter n=1 Tax=Bradyrhizobium sp. CCBAU 53421 TaxID=1325120 RepID=UPI00188D4F35|nr:DMT family transporter [Bradyrhizobium sp. CCBAU 53421]QOZ33231.1 EamA/RhaT family transporter [Bradyrhizobium sp. CCBAU 53421]